jgi:DNA polymerase-3 subunit gamma/tau
MKHVSLYRKWRPRTFQTIAGQEPVVRTLARAIETGRVAHAYLFSGPRGTGKTSTAKVLAMGLNCVNGPTPEPDGTCESCRAIVNNSSMDVLEMDAASNRGIDEIRDLRDRVNLAPTQGRMKVYIIDEVHMLTTEAFNALLKMLEEPPEHVVFVLATTEKHKVLPTIISRCQSFDFRRPGVTLLADKLREIADAEGIEAEPAALTLLAREARGSFRDAEGLLDQLSSYASGPVTAEGVRELLGSVASDVLLETTDALYERRTADSLRVVDRLSGEGRDLSRFVGELVSHLRRLMLLPHAPEVALAEVGGDERAGLEEQANRIPTAEVVRMIEALGDALSRARRGGDPKLEVELTFLKLARDYEEPSVEGLISRLETLEKAVENGTVPAPRPSSDASATAASAPSDAAPREPEVTPGAGGDGGASVETAPPVPEAPEEVVEVGDDPKGEDGRPEPVFGGPSASDLDWGSVVQELRARQPAIAAVYAEAEVEGFDDGVLRLVFPEDLAIYAKLAGDSKRVASLHEILEERLGSRPRLEFGVAGAQGTAIATVPAINVAPPVQERPPEPVGPSRRTPEPLLETEAPMPEPPPVENPPPGPPEAYAYVESGTSASGSVDAGGRGEGASGSEPPADGDGRIRDGQEVFKMAREFFGPDSGRNGAG